MNLTAFRSRKFIVVAGALVGNAALVWYGHIADGVYSAVVISVVATYFAANVTQKATAKSEE